jgi:hypothetical protein
MLADSRSLKDEIAFESDRLLKEFIPYLETEIEKAENKNGLVLCLCQQDSQPEYFPCEQAAKSNVSEIIQVLQAEAHLGGLVIPYAYENLAVICPAPERDKFAEQVDAARKIIASHSFGRGLQQEHLTMSFGLSSYPFDSEFAYELLLQAGMALQNVLQQGGNAVGCYWQMN